MKQQVTIFNFDFKNDIYGLVWPVIYVTKVTYNIIYSTYVPNSDWLKAHA